MLNPLLAIWQKKLVGSTYNLVDSNNNLVHITNILEEKGHSKNESLNSTGMRRNFNENRHTQSFCVRNG
jgi:hypothetical protein